MASIFKYDVGDIVRVAYSNEIRKKQTRRIDGLSPSGLGQHAFSICGKLARITGKKRQTNYYARGYTIEPLETIDWNFPIWSRWHEDYLTLVEKRS